MDRHARLLSCLCLLLLNAGAVRADVLRCKDGAGHVTYTQGSCPSGTRPLDSAGGAPANTSHTSAAVGALSTTAIELKKKADSCTQASSGECRQFHLLRQSCLDGSKRNDPACPAVREVEAVLVANDQALADSGKPTQCPASLALNGSDADVRACSRSRSLTSTATWAQLGEHFDEYEHRRRWTGDYLCLRFLDPAAPGNTVRVRPYLTVSMAVRGGAMVPGFETGAIPDRIFPTKVAAVEAACSTTTAAVTK